MNKAYWKGYESKMDEIEKMGLKAAHEKFTEENPPGIPFKGTWEGYQYGKGENDAILNMVL